MTAPGSASKTAHATIKVDPSKSPKEIDFTYTDGTRKERRSRESLRSSATT